ncbi:MAG: T9SS type A sorting domain-containing protein [Candidatus Syntrophosphaera sp.]|nr:T9SS type A sorting domain-containing protein [Candidatus Syntrophosphaera sp.]
MRKKPALALLRITVFIALLILPLSVSAQALLTFEVDDLEAYNRSGNWIYDADGPGFPTHDGNWFTFSPDPSYLFHYFAERYIHDNGTTTSLVCIEENVPLATDPSQMDMIFTEFDMVAFRRLNNIDPLAPWDMPGQSADERVYANATGYITFNGVPVLTIVSATFVITTPYPSEDQVRALSPYLASWTGDIGSGAPQTGYGFGDLDLANCDPDWAALFAGSDYKVQMNMVGITSTVSPLYGWFDFDLEVLPSPVPFEANNIYLDLTSLPQSIDFPLMSAGVDVTAGEPAGQYNNMQHIYLNEIGIAPLGTLPDGVVDLAPKYWELGSTLTSFNADIRFTLTNSELPGPPENRRILHRQICREGDDPLPWTLWTNYTLLSPTTIVANNVSQIGEFTVASIQDQNVPVVLSSFNAVATAQNKVQINWSSQTESQMVGYRLYRGFSAEQAAAGLLDHPLIPATNSSTLQTYSVTDENVQIGSTYFYWLEAVDYTSSEFFGPVSVSVTGNVPPVLPGETSLQNAYPNPFKTGNSTNIEVAIKAGENGIISIYNMQGQLVKTYKVSEGIHSIAWNGTDGKGKACGSGIYFYKLRTPSFSQTRKMVIIK